MLANPGSLLDPIALILVVAGSLAAAAVRAGSGDIRRAFAALVPLLRADPEGEGLVAMRAVRRIARAAELRTIAHADRVGASQPFLARIAAQLAEAPDADAFREEAEEAIADRVRRHRGAYEFWAAAGDAAPAMGLAGTVIGLIAMFANMDAPEAMGPAMALALLTTLYGVVFGNVMALPVARRLERLSADEIAWQSRAIAHLTKVAAREAEERQVRPSTRIRLTA